MYVSFCNAFLPKKALLVVDRRLSGVHLFLFELPLFSPRVFLRNALKSFPYKTHLSKHSRVSVCSFVNIVTSFILIMFLFYHSVWNSTSSSKARETQPLIVETCLLRLNKYRSKIYLNILVLKLFCCIAFGISVFRYAINNRNSLKGLLKHFTTRNHILELKKRVLKVSVSQKKSVKIWRRDRKRALYNRQVWNLTSSDSLELRFY